MADVANNAGNYDSVCAAEANKSAHNFMGKKPLGVAVKSQNI
jgi:hypothetical protein